MTQNFDEKTHVKERSNTSRACVMDARSSTKANLLPTGAHPSIGRGLATLADSFENQSRPETKRGEY